MAAAQQHSPRRAGTGFPPMRDRVPNGLDGLDIDLGLDEAEAVAPRAAPPRALAHPTPKPVVLEHVTSGGFDAELAPEDGRQDDFSAVLSGVPFHELDDGDVSSSSSASSAARRRGDDGSDSESDWGGVHLTRARSTSPRPVPRFPPRAERVSDCSQCDMCARLAAENRRLRRQLDEAEVRSAEAELFRRDSMRDSDMGRPPHGRASRSSSASSTTAIRGSSGWKRLASRASFSGFSARGKKPSERARLKSEVRALAVTAEYLWRKLSATEKELADVRLGTSVADKHREWEDDFDDVLDARRIDPAALIERKL